MGNGWFVCNIVECFEEECEFWLDYFEYVGFGEFSDEELMIIMVDDVGRLVELLLCGFGFLVWV